MEKIEKHKEDILNMLEKNNDIQSNEDIIRKFLKSELDNHKIQEDEYIELMKFLNEKLMEKDKNKRQLDFKEEVRKFYKSMHLNVMPIYKGEMGIVAPKRENSLKNELEESHKEKEGDER